MKKLFKKVQKMKAQAKATWTNIKYALSVNHSIDFHLVRFVVQLTGQVVALATVVLLLK